MDVSFENDTVWLSKSQMAELFQRDRSVISKHIKNVFEEGELSPESNVQNLHAAHSDKPIDFYQTDRAIERGTAGSCQEVCAGNARSRQVELIQVTSQLHTVIKSRFDILDKHSAFKL